MTNKKGYFPFFRTIFFVASFIILTPALAYAAAGTNETSQKNESVERGALISGRITVSPNEARAGEELIYTARFENDSETLVRNIAFQITLPDGITDRAENSDFKKTSSNTYRYHHDKLVPGETREIRFSAELENVTNQETKTTLMNISYINPNTQNLQEESVRVNVLAKPSVANDGNQNVENDNGFVNMLAGAGIPFFPNSFIEWIILFLILVILVLVFRQLYAIFNESRRNRKARRDSEAHMNDIKARMNHNLGNEAPQNDAPQPAAHVTEDPVQQSVSANSAENSATWSEPIAPHVSPDNGYAAGEAHAAAQTNVPQQQPVEPQQQPQAQMMPATIPQQNTQQQYAQPQSAPQPQANAQPYQQMMPQVMPVAIPMHPYWIQQMQMQQMQQMQNMQNMPMYGPQGYYDPYQMYPYPPQSYGYGYGQPPYGPDAPENENGDQENQS